jgi:hypothetical protein
VHLLLRISLEAPSCLSLSEVMPPISLPEPLPTAFGVSLRALAAHTNAYLIMRPLLQWLTRRSIQWGVRTRKADRARLCVVSGVSSRHGLKRG